MGKLIVIDKESGITSYDVIRNLKREYKTKRIGHCGTLDPMATGVLVVAIDQATKIIQFIDKDDKEYVATAVFGKKYDTGDITGKVTEERKCDVVQSDLEKALKNHTGEIMQTPPMYSAVKINGKKLYQYARNGEKVEVESRKVIVKEIELLNFTPDKFEFRVVVSKGTFIRTLIEDIAKECCALAAMSSLRRVRSGNFTLDKKEYAYIEAINMPKYDVTIEEKKKIQLGQKILTKLNGRYQFIHGDELIAIVDCNGECAKIVRLIAEAL